MEFTKGFSDHLVWLKSWEKKSADAITYSIVFRSTFPVMLMP